MVVVKTKVARMNIQIGQGNVIVEALNSTNMIAYKSDDIINAETGIHGYSHCANSDELNFKVDSHNHIKNSARNKRSSGNCPKSQNKICPVLLVADYQFYQQIFGGGNIVQTTSYLVGLMDDINRIYMQHQFLECGSGFGFQIKDIRIYTSFSRIHNHFNIPAILSPEDILMRFGSKFNTPELSQFCLGHLFIARPLKSNESNVLGLSNVAGAQTRRGRTSSGGICSTNPITENGFSYQANTGLTSFLNSNGNRVLSLQAALVVAHEFGHNWGSHHDPDFSLECAPSHHYPGNYIMYPFSVTGLEPNNKKFSNCSLREIRDVLKAKAVKCFVDGGNDQVLCGNFRVEGKETCDVGLTKSDPCCLECKLTPQSSCSDKNDKCCSNCMYSNNSTICRSESECAYPAYCTGNNTICPEALAKKKKVPTATLR